MVVILPKKALDKTEVSHKNFDIGENDKIKQGPEPEIGTEDQQGPESEVLKGGDTFTNKPGGNIGTEVISPGGDGSNDKSNGPTVLPSNSPLSGKTLLYQHDLEKRKGGKYMTGKSASNVTSQCLYHDVFTMNFRHFLPNDLNFLRFIMKQIITNSMSPPNRRTMTPCGRSQFRG